MKVISGTGACGTRPLANAHYQSLVVCRIDNCKDEKEKSSIQEEIDSLKRERLQELIIQGARLHNQGNSKGTVIVVELFRKELGAVGGDESLWYSPEYNEKLVQVLVLGIDELKKVSWRSRL